MSNIFYIAELGDRKEILEYLRHTYEVEYKDDQEAIEYAIFQLEDSIERKKWGNYNVSETNEHLRAEQELLKKLVRMQKEEVVE